MFLLVAFQTNTHVFRSDQFQDSFLDRSQYRIHHHFFIFHIRGNGSGNLATNIERILQFADIISISHTPPSVQENKENHQEHHPYHHHQEHPVQHLRFLLQGQVTAFQFLVLTGKVQYIQIYVAIVIRLGLHAQCRISHAQLLTETGYPFRHRSDSLLVDPFQLHRVGSHRHIRFQAINCIVAMIILFVMKIHIRKRFREIAQSLLIPALLRIAGSHRTVSSRYLIPIPVSVE